MKNVIRNFLAKDDEKQLTQYLAAISACISLITAGLYQGWGGPSLVKILSDEYPIPVTNEEASYITIIGSVGHVIGGFSASYFCDFIGRKYTILGTAIPQVLSFCLIFASYQSKILLYIARVLGGMGEGAVLASIPSYIAEISDKNIRGTLGGFVTVAMILGLLFINIVGSFFNIHVTALVCLIFPILFWCTFINMPESPYYLLMNKNNEGARKSLQMLRRKQDVDKEFMQLSLDVERQLSEKGTFKDLFTINSNRKAFLIVSAMRFFQVFSGINAFFSYNQILISQTTDFSPVMGSCILIMGNVCGIFLSSFYIDKMGRRTMFIFSSGLSCLVLFAQAIFLTLKDWTAIDISSLSLMPLILILLYNVVFSAGLGPGVNVFIGEIYSTSIKAKGMSLGSIVFASSVIGSTKIYQYTADNAGMPVPFYIFATITFIGLLFNIFWLPETKGKTLETIQQELKGNTKNNSTFNL